MAYSMAHLNIDDDDLETFSIFWLDGSVNNAENLAAQKKLRSIINQLKTFEDPEAFVGRIHRIAQGDRTVLIVSGQWGRIVVPKIHHLRSVSSIYVYCMNKAANEKWSKTYSKVRKCRCVNLSKWHVS
jgi:protein gp37